MSPDDLLAINGLNVGDLLQPGDVLIIPAIIPSASPGALPTPLASPSPGDPVTYIVAEGNTIYGIADLFGVSPDDLLAINGLNAGDLLHVGDILIIPQ